MAEINRDEVMGFLDKFAEIAEKGDEQGMTELTASLLALPDQEFQILSQIILDNMNKELNNPAEKIKLMQAFNISGVKKDELEKALMEIGPAIEESDFSDIKKDFIREVIMLMANAVSDVEGISNRYIQIPIELCGDGKTPTYAHLTDAGMDVYAAEDITINPGETVIVHTGIKVAIPYGYEIQVRPRSGLSAKSKLRIANAPGTIDSGYRDEIGIIIDNIEPRVKDVLCDDKGVVNGVLYGSSYTISKGDRIAQLVLAESIKCVFNEVSSVGVIESDRNGGFGSTGR